MADRRYRILIVESDADTLDMLVEALARRFDARISCVDVAAAGLDLEMAEPQDLVIAELTPGSVEALQWTHRPASLLTRPIILLADDPSAPEAVQALRFGAHDLFVKPFAIEELLDSVETALRDSRTRREYVAKYHRMRELVRRVIRERRDLDRRMELICRDLVGAQRRLVHRVIELEETRSKDSQV